VVKRVNEVQSSIGYADLAVARELKFFSAVGMGGENTTGEQHTKFWAEIENAKTPSAAGFSDPSSDGDVEKPANSRCKTTKYTNETGKKFPPENTREPWNGAKPEPVEKEYSICGLTYDLALRQYKYYPGTTLGEANTVHDFLLWALNKASGGGGSVEKGTDYEVLSSSIIKKAEEGVEEIGFEKAGEAGAKEKT
jgi:hypothetical protein